MRLCGLLESSELLFYELLPHAQIHQQEASLLSRAWHYGCAISLALWQRIRCVLAMCLAHVTTTIHQYLFENGPLKLVEWTRKYGSTYGTYEGLQPVYVTSDLEILNDVFNKKFAYFHGRRVMHYIEFLSHTTFCSQFPCKPIRKVRKCTCSVHAASVGSVFVRLTRSHLMSARSRARCQWCKR